jgi:AcrR family transcriptional regulator
MRVAYHHGNARAALLDAAAALLETEGAAGLSLRQVAERAGLSRQAPYNHFANKEALLAELLREGFERLGDLIRAVSDPPVAASDHLARAADAYIAFGQQRPALFRLMFSRELVDHAKHDDAAQAAAAALAALRAIIETMAPGQDPRDATLAAWSIVHGYTSLCIEIGLEGEEARTRRAKLFACSIEALVHRSGG